MEGTIAMDRVACRQPVAQAVPEELIDTQSIPLAATEKFEDLVDDRPWEGLHIPLVVDETEEGLFSMDSLADYGEVSYEESYEESVEQSAEHDDVPSGEPGSQAEQSDSIPAERPTADVDDMSQPAEMPTIPDDSDDDMSEYEASIDGDAA